MSVKGLQPRARNSNLTGAGRSLSLPGSYSRSGSVRLSGFDHAPWVQRRGAEQQSANRTLRDQVARILLGEVNDRPNAQSRHALGALYLLEQKTDEAIEQLEEALKTDPGNAQIHNDLGVALMELAKTQKEKASRDEQTTEPKSAEQSPGESLKTLARANE